MKNHSKYMKKQWFEEYIRLGGNQKYRKYNTIRDKFEELTVEAFTGDGDKSREECMNEFKTWLNEKYPEERVGLIFESMDNITAYT